MDKVVLITGAGAGMGKAIAEKYAALNLKLSLVDINPKGLKETTEACLKSKGCKVLQTVIDISKDEDVKSLVDNTIREFGKIDVLVNCAGIVRPSNILDSNLIDIYDKLLSVNLRSAVLLTSLCAPHLIKSKGCVVIITSTSAILTTHNLLAYSVSKAGLNHFTKCTALELAPYGVRVNAILPGVVTSKLLTNSGFSEEESQTFISTTSAATPIKRAIETNEVADLVLFLASDKARSITGASYVIDAGMMLSGFNNTL